MANLEPARTSACTYDLWTSEYNSPDGSESEIESVVKHVLKTDGSFRLQLAEHLLLLLCPKEFA